MANVMGGFILLKETNNRWGLVTDVKTDLPDSDADGAVFELVKQLYYYNCVTWLRADFKQYRLKLLQLGSEQPLHPGSQDPLTK